MARFILLATTLFAAAVHAAPTPQVGAPLSKQEIAAFKPFTYYARAVGCGKERTLSWTCGDNCKANAKFKPIASGGDGATTQFWFVGYDPALKTVIVSHQGTDTTKKEAIATDLKFALNPLDLKLFPKVPTGLLVHAGFQEAHARSATQILEAVKKATKQYSAKKVAIVGHSLGAALSLLDGIYLPPHFPGVSFRVIGYGMPRVGNKVFADYVDRQKLSVTRINYGGDSVPHLPLKEMKFNHPAGEIHIHKTSGAWITCPGQENEDAQCTNKAIPNVFSGSVADHLGPFDGVTFGERC
ncbi:hypothetical protein HGRIS_005077 [Hohenbuehelia grisea]|uniref:Fungal lipase-type domain-containing protein n=1 Tax=Hohenbuehelia grisea TaxID=104357 RepID=A0ABR3JDX1_9AGAR